MNNPIINSITIEASEFKAKCLKLIDQIAENNQELIITKDHKPVAKLVPYHKRPKSLWGIDKGRIEIKGDIMSPIDVKWNAMDDKHWDQFL